MHIEYHPHALRRMAERNVSEREVEQTLREYGNDVPAKWGRRNRYKVIQGRRIRITFHQPAPDRFYVWTVTADEVCK